MKQPSKEMPIGIYLTRYMPAAALVASLLALIINALGIAWWWPLLLTPGLFYLINKVVKNRMLG